MEIQQIECYRKIPGIVMSQMWVVPCLSHSGEIRPISVEYAYVRRKSAINCCIERNPERTQSPCFLLGLHRVVSGAANAFRLPTYRTTTHRHNGRAAFRISRLFPDLSWVSQVVGCHCDPPAMVCD